MLPLAAAILKMLRPVAHLIAEVTLRCFGDVPGLEETVLRQLGDPFGIFYIRLAPGNLLDCLALTSIS